MAPSDEQKVTDAIRSRLTYDMGLRRLRPLETYTRIFAGFEAIVAREYDAVIAAAAAKTADAARDTPARAEPPAPSLPPDDSSASAGSSARNRVGPYRLLRELGHGGQGTVHLAEDTRLARQVALKTLSPALATSSGMLDRFRREAAAASRLDHPGICTVYEAGEADGIPYIAMRYVDGETLAARISAARGPAAPAAHATTSDGARSTPTSDAARSSVSTRPEVLNLVAIGEKIARALHVAHEAGLIHRDMKPANIMIAKDGEPVILDFGLAREESADGAGLTMTGALLGTPSYMSPEQLMAQRIALDRRTDVYSLGVTLYEALTLRLPFEAPTREALYQRILTTDAPNPRRYNAAIPGDLRVVLETAMEKDRDRRYLSALDFAEDLRRVREMQPIRARPVGRAARLGRWAMRNPALASAVGGLFVSLAAGLGVAVSLLHEARRERDDKDIALAASERERVAKESALVRAEALRLAVQSSEALHTDPTLALLLGLEAAERQPSPTAVGAVAAAVDACCEERTLVGHDGPVLGVRFTGDGARLVSASTDGTARVWDAEDGRELLVIHSPDAFTSGPAVSPNGMRVAIITSAAELGIWDLATGRRLVLAPRVRPSEPAEQLRMSPDGAWIAALRPEGTPVLISAADGTVRDLPTPASETSAWRVTAFSEDSRYVAGWAWRGGAVPSSAVCVWDTQSARMVFSIADVAVTLAGSCLRADATGMKLVALRTTDGHARCGEFDVTTGDWTAWPDLDGAGQTWAVYGDILLASDYGGTPLIAKPGLPSAPIRLEGHTDAVAGMRPMPRDRVLTWSLDGTARIWDRGTGRPAEVLRGAGADRGDAPSVEVDPAGRRLATLRSNSDVIRLWRADGSGAPPSVTVPDDIPVYGALCWSRDGRRLAVRGDRISLIDVPGRTCLPLDIPKEAHGAPLGFSDSNGLLIVRTVGGVEAWTPDGARRVWQVPITADHQWFAVLKQDIARVRVGSHEKRSVVEISVTDGSVTRSEPPPGADMLLSGVGPDGTYVSTKDCIVRIWDDSRGVMLTPIEAPLAGLSVSALGPARIWTSAWDGRILVHTLDGSTPPVVLAADGGIIGASRDGGIVATSNSIGTGAALWDVRTGRRCDAVPLDGGGNTRVVVSPNGARCAQYARSDLTLRVFDISDGRELLTLTGATGATTVAAFAPDSERIAAATQKGRITIWPIDVIRAAKAARPRELTLEERVRYLDRKEDRDAMARSNAAVASAAEITAEPAVARKFLRERGGLTEPELRAALRTVQQWPDAWALLMNVWPAVMRGGDRDTLRLADLRARAAFAMLPDASNMRLGLAGIRYRRGDFAGVVELVAWETLPTTESERGIRAATLSFLAMAQHRLGNAAAADRAIADVRTFMAGVDSASFADTSVIAAEAERTLAEPPR